MIHVAVRESETLRKPVLTIAKYEEQELIKIPNRPDEKREKEKSHEDIFRDWKMPEQAFGYIKVKRNEIF